VCTADGFESGDSLRKKLPFLMQLRKNSLNVHRPKVYYSKIAILGGRPKTPFTSPQQFLLLQSTDWKVTMKYFSLILPQYIVAMREVNVECGIRWAYPLE
jgi:hypothetical protein